MVQGVVTMVDKRWAVRGMVLTEALGFRVVETSGCKEKVI